jgi:hypothetical protein
MRAMWKRLRTRLVTRFEQRKRLQLQLQVENLESRTLLSTSHLDGVFASPASFYSPRITNPTPVGYTPTEIRHAYGFDQVAFNDGAIVGDGSGQTIGIVDAYGAPTLASDLRTFDRTFNLPDPVLTKVEEYVHGQPPRTDSGWALETALDVEWAHAAAPGAKILLVETASSSLSDLLSGVDYARSYSGVSVVSMSWGGGEFAGETSLDSHFTTPTGHSGVTFIASSGDTGGSVDYPAVSPNVVAVGGTTLNLASNGTIASESAWSGSGGGVSTYESKPSYQAGVLGTGDGRSSPDVALNADPTTGYAVYDSYGYSHQNGWFQLGGTSAGAPQWAGLVAVANQGRALAGTTALDGATQTLPSLYSMPATNLNTVASSATSGQSTSGSGYNLITGRGTPVASLVVQSLAGVPVSAPTTVAQTTTSTSSTQTTHTTQGAKNGSSGTANRAAFISMTDPTQVLVNGIPLPAQVLGPTVPLPTVTQSPVIAPVNQDLQQGRSAAAGLLDNIRNAVGYKNAGGKEVLIRAGGNRDEPQEKGAAPQGSDGATRGARGQGFLLPGADQECGAISAEQTDTYFMSDEVQAGGMASSWLTDDQIGWFTQSFARLAGLMMITSGYWTANLVEPESRRRRLALTKQ